MAAVAEPSCVYEWSRYWRIRVPSGTAGTGGAIVGVGVAGVGAPASSPDASGSVGLESPAAASGSAGFSPPSASAGIVNHGSRVTSAAFAASSAVGVGVGSAVG
ncbi:MAG: hypothetical protein EBS89_03115, partial [Proteobacteria bacterium]|nr:hypothetical protein [Pseudomonadota bacterium]